MHINDVAAIVGLTRKSIMYYESVGLVSPLRNSNNDYREYSDLDISKLKLIKFLRELGVPIRDIKALDLGDISFKECLEERIEKINYDIENLEMICDMCHEIIDSGCSYSNIDVSNYFREIRVLNKEGVTLRDVRESHAKRIVGAVLSSSVFIGFFGVLIGVFTYGYFNSSDMPFWVYLILVGVFGLFIVSILYNLYLRIKEIRGGIEDEAFKY